MLLFPHKKNLGVEVEGVLSKDIGRGRALVLKYGMIALNEVRIGFPLVGLRDYIVCVSSPHQQVSSNDCEVDN